MPEPNPEQWGVFTGTARGELQARYYYHLLVVKFGVQSDIARIVVEYANDGFVVGQQIDVKDGVKKWCAAEVLTIHDTRMDIHYVGWSSRHDELIDLPSTRVEYAFTMTRITMENLQRAERRAERPFKPGNVPLMIAARCLGINSHEEAVAAYARFGNDYQAMINGLRYENHREEKSRI
eukprot:TRINITY_DN1149_c0_g1_i1.p1 TRINITY_DN1149_c0_g1~~TRINITY_DN1149_c0_g1_i1.p1  ORF type:complete len:179 (-),score=41.23 TRINITY_DN1149_c0_g1_i1:109-645(-)